MTRRAGLILHPTSLPSAGGIGTLGKEARAFVDFLASAGLGLWQILPLGPTGLGNSPYMTTSAFAGNPLLIDLAAAIEAGWVPHDAIGHAPERRGRVDFDRIVPFKAAALATAHGGFLDRASDELRAELATFCRDEASWLDDFALFTALFEAYNELWSRWPAPLRDRESEALEAARAEHASTIDRICFEQWLFRRQWDALRAYANENRVELIGDIPIFVAHNSADVWAHPELFELVDGEPTVVSGVPPDYFTPKGQRWGNPLYRWSAMAEDGYRWWIRRFEAALGLVDMVRVDHFRGFVEYWEIPAASETAIEGRWLPGPGRALFDALRQALGDDLPIIAEDLGIIDEAVNALRDQLALPGMKVLQFAFLDGDPHNLHLPHMHIPRSVAYTGTHDNDTSVGFYLGAEDEVRDRIRQYFQIDGHDIAWQLMTAAWRSVAELALAPVQDALSLGGECRLNTPGEADGNWDWRLVWGQINQGTADGLRAITERYGRSVAA